MSLTDSSFESRYAVAQTVAREAGQLTLQYFGKEIDVQWKADDSPVTRADREAELLIRKRIEDSFPEDSILGEEFPERAGDSPFRWIVDPIDGTKSFVSGVPLFATLIGLEWEGRSVVGVIELPALGESLSALEGRGAWFTPRDGERRPARVGQFRSLSEGLFLTSERLTFDQRDAGQTYQELEAAAWNTRTWGDAYGYSLVATGRAAVMIDAMMSVWDAAAIQPILHEAGGVFTNWQGEQTIHGGEGIGTTAELLPEILAITRRAVPLPNR